MAVGGLIAGIAGGGGSGGPGLARQAPGGPGVLASNRLRPQVRTGTVIAITSVCMPASRPARAGDPPPGQCVTVLPDGHRYQCPIGIANGLADATQVATNPACHRVAPPMIPVSWRPAIVQMNDVKRCLQRAGLTVGGTATPPSAVRAYPDTPVAGLLISGINTRPAVVSFYLTAAQARQAYERTLSTVTRQAQGMARRGRVLYTWNNQPASRATTERGCVRAV